MKADTEDEVRRLAGLFGVDDENSIELVQQLIDEKWIEEIQGAQEGVAIESFDLCQPLSIRGLRCPLFLSASITRKGSLEITLEA